MKPMNIREIDQKASVQAGSSQVVEISEENL
jgi:hypothetical protein